MKPFLTAVLVAVSGYSLTASADWQLVTDASTLWFGSIKNHAAGETHRFHNLSGSIDDDGQVTIEIAPDSVDTGIEIRDERMLEHVLDASPAITVKAQVALDDFTKLTPGDTLATQADTTLQLGQNSVENTAEVFIARLSEEQWLVSADAPLWITTEALGIEAGIDKLQELAGLEAITRTSPVGFRLLFRQAP